MTLLERSELKYVVLDSFLIHGGMVWFLKAAITEKQNNIYGKLDTHFKKSQIFLKTHYPSNHIWLPNYPKSEIFHTAVVTHNVVQTLLKPRPLNTKTSAIAQVKMAFFKAFNQNNVAIEPVVISLCHVDKTPAFFPFTFSCSGKILKTRSTPIKLMSYKASPYKVLTVIAHSTCLTFKKVWAWLLRKACCFLLGQKFRV